MPVTAPEEGRYCYRAKRRQIIEKLPFQATYHTCLLWVPAGASIKMPAVIRHHQRHTRGTNLTRSLLESKETVVGDGAR
jgi:hypothetical protein